MNIRNGHKVRPYVYVHTPFPLPLWGGAGWGYPFFSLKNLHIPKIFCTFAAALINDKMVND